MNKLETSEPQSNRRGGPPGPPRGGGPPPGGSPRCGQAIPPAATNDEQSHVAGLQKAPHRCHSCDGRRWPPQSVVVFKGGINMLQHMMRCPPTATPVCGSHLRPPTASVEDRWPHQEGGFCPNRLHIRPTAWIVITCLLACGEELARLAGGVMLWHLRGALL